MSIHKDAQYYKFCAYGFLKNLRFFDAFFILFLVKRGLSYTEIGTLYATREIFVNILEIPSGILADSFGRKNALVSSFLAYILSFILFYNSFHFLGFLVAFLLYGVGEAFRSGTHKGMIMHYLKWKEQSHLKVSYYGHTRSWSQKGSAVSSIIAGVAVFCFGNYDSIFLFSAIPYVLNTALILSYPRELNFSAVSKKRSVQRLGITTNTFGKVIKQPGVLKIMSTAAFHTAYLKAVKDYIQPLMVQVAVLIPWLHETESTKKNALTIGLIYFFIYLLTSKASQKAGLFSKSNKGTVAFSTLVIGFSAGIICSICWYFEVWIVALVAFAVIYIIESLRKPILTGAISDQVPNDILTSVLSAQAQLKTIMTALLAFVFGIMADLKGIEYALLLVSVMLLVLSISIKKLFSDSRIT
jgi:MFS family permease